MKEEIIGLKMLLQAYQKGIIKEKWDSRIRSVTNEDRHGLWCT
jgi:hypothetical protein